MKKGPFLCDLCGLCERWVFGLARFARVRRGRGEKRFLFKKSLRGRFFKLLTPPAGFYSRSGRFLSIAGLLTAIKKMFLLCGLCALCERQAFYLGLDLRDVVELVDLLGEWAVSGRATAMRRRRSAY